jgi:hypothetical protein
MSNFYFVRERTNSCTIIQREEKIGKILNLLNTCKLMLQTCLSITTHLVMQGSICIKIGDVQYMYDDSHLHNNFPVM